MRKTMICAALLTFVAAPTLGEKAAIALPGWLAGAWEQRTGDAWVDEFWTPPRGGLMIGAGRTGKGEALKEFEHTRIVRKADGSLSFFAQPGGVPPTEFPLVASGPAMVEFANPAHDYPQRVRYWREGKLLKARISKMDGSDAAEWTYAPMGGGPLMARERPFKQVDVFTAVPLQGNPVAVVLDAAGLSEAQMQAFAAWTNLSETTFVTPPGDPGADYAVRIFTPRSELPFAGHPTLGTAHAVLEAGLTAVQGGRLVQQCAVGLVELAVDRDGLSFRLPRYAVSPAPGGDEATAWLGGASAIAGGAVAVDVGPVWHVAEFADAAGLEALTPDYPRLAAYTRAHRLTGSTLYAVHPDGRVVVRSFAPADGIDEDPVCGSGNASVAAYRLGIGQIASGDRYVASQGRQVGRDGRVSVRIDGADIHVGGVCVTGIDGKVML